MRQRLTQYRSAVTLLLMLSFHSHAEDRIEMQGTAIIGNQELPKVLYIVPWKQSELPDIAELPIEPLINDALSPIEREVFRRQISYHSSISKHKD